MENICQQHHLLYNDQGIVRVPFIVKGKLIAPPEIDRTKIEAAFSKLDRDAHYLKLPNAQILREPLIDRATMKYTPDYLYQIMPSIDPLELIETDIEQLVRGPYAVSVEDILQYLSSIGEVLQNNWTVIDRVKEIYRRTAEHPDVYLDGVFATLQVGFDPQAARCMIDNELSIWQIPGSRFLEGWVNVPSNVMPGLVPLLARSLRDQETALVPDALTSIRAMPTRQLHITAGNAPEVPIVSALRLVLTKSAGVIKLPFGATLPGALVALASIAAMPDHPLTQHLSIVYWQGGDESIENALFMPNAFDRIVVWGAPDAVTSVQSRTVFTKTVCFNPRYGISLIGREAFEGDLKPIAFAAAMDAMIYNQKACTASQVQYVEGTEDQIKAYADCLRQVLSEWDAIAPQIVPPSITGRLKRMQRGKYLRADWLLNMKGNEFSSGVVVMPDEFNILDHPMCRLIMIRRVDDLRDVQRYLHQAVAMIGVYPEARRIDLRDLLLAHGVSSVLPLGYCERVFPGAPQDGMMVLNQLVDWKNG